MLFNLDEKAVWFIKAALEGYIENAKATRSATDDEDDVADLDTDIEAAEAALGAFADGADYQSHCMRVLSDLASRECEHPVECQKTENPCLPCRARWAIDKEG